MFILVILAYLIVGFLEIPPLIKDKEKRELIVYSTLFFISFILSLLLSFGVKIPSPLKPIETFILSITGGK